LSQRPLQQSPSFLQLPLVRHWQTPPAPHTPLQQSEAWLQLPPTAAQLQWPVLSQVPEQQSVLLPQVTPSALQAHFPFEQRSVQQSPSFLQLFPDGVQSQMPKPAALQRPLQQSVLTVQNEAGGPQQAPSAHTRPLVHVTVLQPLPLGTQPVPDLVKPESQMKSQLPPLQVGLALAGGLQGVQELPHDCGLALARQRSLQAWKPGSQVMPHTAKVQVGCPCTTDGQGSQEPQCCGSLLVEAQRPLQLVGAVAGQVATQEKLAPLGAQSGVAPSQAWLQEPQCAGSARSVSQPGCGLQSPKPARQALPMKQPPLTQMTREGSTLGTRVQSLPQPPQWCGSLFSMLGSQAPKSTLLSMKAGLCALQAVRRRATSSSRIPEEYAFFCLISLEVCVAAHAGFVGAEQLARLLERHALGANRLFGRTPEARDQILG
jgi:hypothetical protein